MWQITYPVRNFVASHRGTLPVILTCPHNGDAQPPTIPGRKRENTPAGCDFEDSHDLNTRKITTGVAQRLLDTCGEAPYVVIAEFSRRAIDANRPAADRTPNCAYEVPAAKPYYDEYHSTICEFIAEIRAENGGLGLLFDVHGTAQDSADVYLGTDDGKAIARLLSVDAHAMERRRSLFGFLDAAGYTVLPRPPNLPAPPSLNGGYTVQTYGSSHADGLDAIQLEITGRLRNVDSDREVFIEHLARAIGNLVARYADTHTLAAFGSIHVYGGDNPEAALGQMQPSEATHDVRLRLGGGRLNRGRVEVRHDSGGTGGPTAPRRAGVLVLYDENGRDYFLWVDTQGKLRISPTDPAERSDAGTIVGTQT